MPWKCDLRDTALGGACAEWPRELAPPSAPRPPLRAAAEPGTMRSQGACAPGAPATPAQWLRSVRLGWLAASSGRTPVQGRTLAAIFRTEWHGCITAGWQSRISASTGSPGERTWEPRGPRDWAGPTRLPCGGRRSDGPLTGASKGSLSAAWSKAAAAGAAHVGRGAPRAVLEAAGPPAEARGGGGSGWNESVRVSEKAGYREEAG